METQTLEGVATETENAPEMVKVLVEKRDGRVVDFDPINIISAVKSAFADLDKKIGPQEERLIRDIANQVEAEIKDRYNGPAKIEDIQNLVEHGLIEDHLYDVARTYTNYRLNKDIERAKATDIKEAVKRQIVEDISHHILAFPAGYSQIKSHLLIIVRPFAVFVEIIDHQSLQVLFLRAFCFSFCCHILLSFYFFASLPSIDMRFYKFKCFIAIFEIFPLFFSAFTYDRAILSVSSRNAASRREWAKKTPPFRQTHRHGTTVSDKSVSSPLLFG